MKEGDVYVEAFARGLAVIKAFGNSGGALTLSEIATRSGLTAAGARRLLLTLVTLGYARQRGRQFELSPRILDLGFAYLSSLPLREVARKAVSAFATETVEVCTVAVLDGRDVVYIARSEVRSPLAHGPGVGERLPAHATSTGQVLLGGLSAPELAAWLAAEPYPRFTEHTRCNASDLGAAITAARAQGYALADQELELGVCGLAVPVRDRDQQLIAAVTLSVNLARYSPADLRADLLPKLRATARQIELGLGNLHASPDRREPLY